MQRAQTTDTHVSRHSSRKYQNPRLARADNAIQVTSAFTYITNYARGATPRLSDPTCVLVPGRHNNETRAGAGGPFPRRSNESGGTIHTTQRQRRVGQSRGHAPRAFAALAGPLLPTRAMGPFLRLLTPRTLRARWLLALPPPPRFLPLDSACHLTLQMTRRWAFRVPGPIVNVILDESMMSRHHTLGKGRNYS